MRLLFLLGGVPKRLKDVIERSDREKIEKKDNNNDKLRIFTEGRDQTYSLERRTELLTTAVDWVGTLGLDEPFGLAVLHVRTSDGSDVALLRDFFPFALQTSLERPVLPSGSTALRAVKNRFVREVMQGCVALRGRAKAMHEHLSSSAKATPLLLPLRNFAEPPLRDRLLSLYGAGGGGDSMVKSISWARNRLEDELPRQVSSGREYYYSNGLLFVPPGDQGHAIAEPREGCPSRCFLAGRSRLGASFNPRLHYDCRPLKGSLDAHYPSCHGQPATPPRATHVNIAPNDYVR